MMILMTEKLVFTFNFLVKVELTHFAQMFCWRFEKKIPLLKVFALVSFAFFFHLEGGGRCFFCKVGLISTVDFFSQGFIKKKQDWFYVFVFWFSIAISLCSSVETQNRDRGTLNLRIRWKLWFVKSPGVVVSLSKKTKENRDYVFWFI